MARRYAPHYDGDYTVGVASGTTAHYASAIAELLTDLPERRERIGPKAGLIHPCGQP